MADGEDFILGQANDSTSETTLHRAAANTVGAALTVKNDKGEGVSGTGGPGYPGVYGSSNGGIAVEGQSIGYTGVLGFTDSSFGVHGISSSNAGIRGESTNGPGLWANSAQSTGVIAGGRDYGGRGLVSAALSNSVGVYGSSPNGFGVWASGGDTGLVARNPNNPQMGAYLVDRFYAGFFSGGRRCCRQCNSRREFLGCLRH